MNTLSNFEAELKKALLIKACIAKIILTPFTSANNL